MSSRAPKIKCANIFCRKNVRSFFSAKAPHIFSAKNGSVFMYNRNFNVTLTNDIVSFEQLGPEFAVVCTPGFIYEWCETTEMVLSFRTERSEQTVYTQDRMLQSDQSLHCLPFPLQLLYSLLYGKATMFKF